jgi:hypothetical protein
VAQVYGVQLNLSGRFMENRSKYMMAVKTLLGIFLILGRGAFFEKLIGPPHKNLDFSIKIS